MAEEQKNEQPKVEASNVSSDSKLLAAVSYLWICSVIIYLVKKDDEYVKFHAKQGVVIFAISVIGFFIGLFTFGIGSMIIGLLTFVMVVVGAVKAYQGERYKFPVISDWAEKINF